MQFCLVNKGSFSIGRLSHLYGNSVSQYKLVESCARKYTWEESGQFRYIYLWDLGNIIILKNPVYGDHIAPNV